MKKFFKFAALAALAAAFVSCTEKPEPDNTPDTPNQEETPKVEINENLAFTLEVKEVAADQAKIKVETNGTNKDTWYGFVTTETNVDAAIQNKVSELTADGGKVSGLKKNTNTTITVRNLEAETEYTYIVFGITEDGNVYGKSASVKFTTARGEIVFSANPAWTVEYTGAGTIGENTYEHTVTVTSTDNNKYFITAIRAAEWSEDNVKAIAEEEFAFIKDYLAKFNAAYGTSYTVKDILYSGSGKEAFDLTGGDWYALAIGVDSNDELSGLYAKSAVITIQEEELTAEYAAWLGDWTITGANGVQQYVTFSKDVANQTYLMTGYEGEGSAGLDITVDWMAEQGIWAIYNQNFGTFTFTIDQKGTQADGEIWFVGQTAEGNLYLDEIPVCIGGVTEDGAYAAYGYEETWTNEDGTPGSYVVDSMLYLAYFPELGKLSYITGTYQTGYPTFPMTFTKNETRSMSEASVRSLTKLPMTYKTFEGGSFNIL